MSVSSSTHHHIRCNRFHRLRHCRYHHIRCNRYHRRSRCHHSRRMVFEPNPGSDGK